MAKDEKAVSAKPTVSLCLITRDEADFIENCISSVAGYVDQIVVVDTGSQDDTMDRARTLGAEVHELAWTDDYAAARNASLEHATGDWILMLDADGELDQGSTSLLRQLVEQNDRSVTHAGKARSYLSNGEVSDTMFRILWPNHLGYHFVGRVHEQLLDARGSSEFTTVSVDLVMHHYGYLKEVWEGKNKAERYRHLIELELQAKPDDFMTRFHAASHFLTLKEYEQSLAHYAWCVEQVESGKVRDSLANEWRALALGNMCGAYIQLNRFDEAVDAGERAVGAHAGISLAWYWLGMARARAGDLDGGIEAMQRARGLGDGTSSSLLVTNQAMSGWLAEQALGEIYFLKEDHDRAIQHLDQQIELNPTNADGWLISAMAHAAKGDFDSALERFGVGTSLADPGERAAQAYERLRDVANRLDPMEIVLRSLQTTWGESINVRRWLLDVLEARLSLAESAGLAEDGRTVEARQSASRVASAWPALDDARLVLDRLDRQAFPN